MYFIDESIRDLRGIKKIKALREIIGRYKSSRTCGGLLTKIEYKESLERVKELKDAILDAGVILDWFLPRYCFYPDIHDSGKPYFYSEDSLKVLENPKNLEITFYIQERILNNFRVIISENRAVEFSMEELVRRPEYKSLGHDVLTLRKEACAEFGGQAYSALTDILKDGGIRVLKSDMQKVANFSDKFRNRGVTFGISLRELDNLAEACLNKMHIVSKQLPMYLASKRIGKYENFEVNVIHPVSIVQPDHAERVVDFCKKSCEKYKQE
jgi:hypothetical protein